MNLTLIHRRWRNNNRKTGRKQPRKGDYEIVAESANMPDCAEQNAVPNEANDVLAVSPNEKESKENQAEIYRTPVKSFPVSSQQSTPVAIVSPIKRECLAEVTETPTDLPITEKEVLLSEKVVIWPNI